MSVIPVDRLCRSDLLMLGNNLVPGGSPRPRRRRAPAETRAHRRALAAVNRSLAAAGERVSGLHPTCTPTPC